MINFINFKSPIKMQNVSFKSQVVNKSADTFESSGSATLNEAIKVARNDILNKMRGGSGKGKEYGIVLSSDGRRLDEIQGDENSCKIDDTKLEEGCIFIHGHPKESLLSATDIASFMINPKITSIEAITPNGRISKMTKTDKTQCATDYSKLLLQLSKYTSARILGITKEDEEITQKDIINLGRSFLKNMRYPGYETMEDGVVLDILQKMYPKTDYNRLFTLLPPYHKDKMTMLIQEKLGEIPKDTNEEQSATDIVDFEVRTSGIERLNEFWQEWAREHNMTYVSELIEN